MPRWVSFCRPAQCDGRHLGFGFKDVFPVTMFANEALVGRFVLLESGKWIETSSPGLLGQSGGPLVGTDGLIRGMQVNTRITRPAFFWGTIEEGGQDPVPETGRVPAYYPAASLDIGLTSTSRRIASFGVRPRYLGFGLGVVVECSSSFRICLFVLI